MIKNTFGDKAPILKALEGNRFNIDTLMAVLRGNKRSGVGRERFRVFPTSASEANNPQTVRRVR